MVRRRGREEVFGALFGVLIFRFAGIGDRPGLSRYDGKSHRAVEHSSITAGARSHHLLRSQ